MLKARLEEETAYLAYLPDDPLAGKQVPEYRFADLDEEDEWITADPVAGKPYILLLYDIQYCGTESFVAAYEDLYQRYRDRGLNVVHILSSDVRSNAEWQLETLAYNDYTTGWLNGWYPTGDDSPLLQWKENPYMALALLVDGDGKVVASGERMMPKAALVTVPKFFEGK